MSDNPGLSAEDLRVRLARSYLRGEGEPVRVIWRMISKAELSEELSLEWARTVANWIIEPSSQTLDGALAQQDDALSESIKATNPRAQRHDHIHAALAISGWAEPRLDTLEDEQLLLMIAKSGLRPAAEAVWELIANGEATQGLRDQWLDHVAHGILEIILEAKDGEIPANRRGDTLLPKLGLSGKSKETTQSEIVAVVCRVITMFPKEAYADRQHKYISAIIGRLQKLGAISTDISDEERKLLASLLRKEIANHPPPQAE